MTSQDGRHPFFNAMVLMGSGIAVGCGGTVVERRAIADRGDASPSGSGGRESMIFRTGGTGAMGLGTQIISPPATGGTTYVTNPRLDAGASLPSTDGGTSVCPPSQRDCGRGGSACNASLNAWMLPPECGCNPRRPRSDHDCGPNQTFVCRKGVMPVDGGPETQNVVFDCYCVENVQDCTVCDAVYNDYWQGQCTTQTYADGRRDIFCGCAVIYLR